MTSLNLVAQLTLEVIAILISSMACSAGKGAVIAGASLRPPVNWTSGRSSNFYMHCGCAKLIFEYQPHNDMDILCLFRECI